MDPYALDRDGLAALVSGLDEPPYRARQVHGWLVRGVDDPERMTDLPAPLRRHLAVRFAPTRPELARHRASQDGRTDKLLLRLPDGEAIETVVMRYPRRATVCVSTQAGCALGCPFCATGQAGFRRQLTPGEIVRQVVVADAIVSGRRPAAEGEVEVVASDPCGRQRGVSNVVFMGMGEPLANLDGTLAAVRWITDPDGFGLSARSITVSTVGLVPGIRRLTRLGPPITLAVSLHAATDELRDQLVPINRSHPLAELEGAVDDHRRRTGRRVTLEWCLIAEVNDGADQADGLASMARRLAAHVNVIPMNPIPGSPWREPDPAATRAFVAHVRDRGVTVTLRDTRGRDVDAACGQLAAATGVRLPAAAGASRRAVRSEDG